MSGPEFSAERARRELLLQERKAKAAATAAGRRLVVLANWIDRRADVDPIPAQMRELGMQLIDWGR